MYQHKDNTKNFVIQKIKGDFAELICKYHFELMGCSVDKVGIEELSPTFAKLDRSIEAIHTLKKRLQFMPDFLVVHPSNNKASFVEVKYRKNLTKEKLKTISEAFHSRYEEFIKDNIPIYFYLLTNKPPYVYIMKANSLKYLEDVGGFYDAKNTTLDRFSFFKSTSKEKYFTKVYEDIIINVIKELQGQ